MKFFNVIMKMCVCIVSDNHFGKKKTLSDIWNEQRKKNSSNQAKTNSKSNEWITGWKEKTTIIESQNHNFLTRKEWNTIRFYFVFHIVWNFFLFCFFTPFHCKSLKNLVHLDSSLFFLLLLLLCYNEFWFVSFFSISD